MYNSFRHGIIQHQQSVGVQTFLSYTSGYVNLHVANRHLTYTIAHGSADYLFSEISDTYEAWEVNANVVTWLGIDIDMIDGERQFVATTVEPRTGPTPPQGIANQYWFDTNTNTMKKWMGSRYVPCLTLFLAAVRLGSFMPLVNLSTYVGSTVGLNNSCNPGSVLFDEASRLLYKSDGTILTTEDRMSSAIHKSSHVKIGSIGFLAVAGENIPRHHFVVLKDDGRVYLTDGSDVGTHLHGVVEYDHNIGDVVRVCTEGYFEDPAWNWPTIGVPVYANSTGKLTETSNSKYYPVGYVVSPKSVHLTTIGQYHVHPILGTGAKGDKGEAGATGQKGEPGVGGSGGTGGNGFIYRTGGSTKPQLGVNLSAYVTESVVNGDYTYPSDFDLVLRTSNNGAITVEYAGSYDGVTGRSVRGMRALDFQRGAEFAGNDSTNSTKVAAGPYTTILNGQNNRADGYMTSILSGTNNSTNGRDSIIVSGMGNTISSDSSNSMTTNHVNNTMAGSINSTIANGYGNSVLGGRLVTLTDTYGVSSFGDVQVTGSGPESSNVLSAFNYLSQLQSNSIMVGTTSSTATGFRNQTFNTSYVSGSASNSLIANVTSSTYSTNKMLAIGSTNSVHTNSGNVYPTLNQVISLFSSENLSQTGNWLVGPMDRIGVIFAGPTITDSNSVFNIFGNGQISRSIGVVGLNSADVVNESYSLFSVNSTNSTFTRTNGMVNFGSQNTAIDTRGGSIVGSGAVNHVSGSHVKAAGVPKQFYMYQINPHMGQAQTYDVILTSPNYAEDYNDESPTHMTVLRSYHTSIADRMPVHEINMLESSSIVITGEIISTDGVDTYNWSVRVICERRMGNQPVILSQQIVTRRGPSGCVEVVVMPDNVIRFRCDRSLMGSSILADLHVVEMNNRI